ncbi:MAG: hypothetical protein ACLU9S_13815 [Oscillospiraceae bacterium]
MPFGWTGTGGDLHYATELVKFVRKEFGDKFTIAVARLSRGPHCLPLSGSRHRLPEAEAG